MLAEGAGVAFEVERLEVTGGDRLEVAGRWTGVRGMRFVRPSLIVRSGAGERSVLAVLDHKPWAPEEGRSWIAAFPWAGEAVDPQDAKLAVTQSIVVPLAAAAPEVPARKRGGKPRETLREQLESERRRTRRLEAEVAYLREQHELLTARVQSAEHDSGRAAAEAVAASERDARTQADEVMRTEREAALIERESAAREREELHRERETLRRDLEAARRDRDALRRARDEAFAERDAALVGRDAARAAARNRSGARPVRTLNPPSIAEPPDWVTRALIVAAAICLLLLLVGLLRIL